MQDSLCALSLLLLAATHYGEGQVLTRSVLRRAETPLRAGAADAGSITVSTLPATVKLAGYRTEEGRFLILTEPAQKLYWWRFLEGTPPAPDGDVEEFGRGCMAVPGKGQFGVFCATDRRIMVSIARKTYSDGNDLADLVAKEFNGRASHLDSGLDYFDKVLNLWGPLGQDFFVEPGSAIGLSRIQFLSIKQPGDGWEVVVGGVGGQAARVVLNSTLDLVESKLLARQANQR